MSTRRRVTGAVTSGAIAVTSFVAMSFGVMLFGVVHADDPSPPIDDQALAEIDALIPQTAPGEYDPVAAEQVFDQLESVVGATEFTGGGSSLTGACGGFAFSYDGDGKRIDAAFDAGTDAPPVDLVDGGQAFTSGNPFKVDTDGTVVYYGFMPRSGDGPRDHSWSVETSGVSLDTGGDPNTNGKNRNTGLVDLGADLPVKFAAKASISGRLDSSNIGSCVGSGHIDFVAPFANPVTIGSIVLLGGGVLGLLFNSRPARTWRR
jgi:hypothetical protein